MGPRRNHHGVMDEEERCAHRSIIIVFLLLVITSTLIYTSMYTRSSENHHHHYHGDARIDGTSQRHHPANISYPVLLHKSWAPMKKDDENSVLSPVSQLLSHSKLQSRFRASCWKGIGEIDNLVEKGRKSSHIRHDHRHHHRHHPDNQDGTIELTNSFHCIPNVYIVSPGKRRCPTSSAIYEDITEHALIEGVEDRPPSLHSAESLLSYANGFSKHHWGILLRPRTVLLGAGVDMAGWTRQLPRVVNNRLGQYDKDAPLPLQLRALLPSGQFIVVLEDPLFAAYGDKWGEWSQASQEEQRIVFDQIAKEATDMCTCVREELALVGRAHISASWLPDCSNMDWGALPEAARYVTPAWKTCTRLSLEMQGVNDGGERGEREEREKREEREEGGQQYGLTSLASGMHGIWVEEWLSLWPRENLHFVSSSRYRANSSLVKKEIIQFLDMADVEEDKGMEDEQSRRGKSKRGKVHLKESGYDGVLSSSNVLEEITHYLRRFYYPFQLHLDRLLGERGRVRDIEKEKESVVDGGSGLREEVLGQRVVVRASIGGGETMMVKERPDTLQAVGGRIAFPTFEFLQDREAYSNTIYVTFPPYTVWMTYFLSSSADGSRLFHAKSVLKRSLETMNVAPLSALSLDTQEIAAVQSSVQPVRKVVNRMCSSQLFLSASRNQRMQTLSLLLNALFKMGFAVHDDTSTHKERLVGCEMGECSAMVAAARCGGYSLITLLVQNGGDVNTRSGRYGRTPLHVAAVAGNAEGTLALLEAGAQMNIEDDFGYTFIDMVVAPGAPLEWMSTGRPDTKNVGGSRVLAGALSRIVKSAESRFKELPQLLGREVEKVEQGKGEADVAGCWLERVESLSHEEFLSSYVALARPIIVQSAYRDWPEILNVSISLLRSISVRLPNDVSTYEGKGTRQQRGGVAITIGEYLDNLVDTSRNHERSSTSTEIVIPMRDTSRPEVAAIFNKLAGTLLVAPGFVGSTSALVPQLIVGREGVRGLSTSPTIPRASWYMLLDGEIQWSLTPPTSGTTLSQNTPLDSAETISSVKPSNSSKRLQKCLQKAGEVIWIPERWGSSLLYSKNSLLFTTESNEKLLASALSNKAKKMKEERI